MIFLTGKEKHTGRHFAYTFLYLTLHLICQLIMNYRILIRMIAVYLLLIYNRDLLAFSLILSKICARNQCIQFLVILYVWRQHKLHWSHAFHLTRAFVYQLMEKFNVCPFRTTVLFYIGPVAPGLIIKKHIYD